MWRLSSHLMCCATGMEVNSELLLVHRGYARGHFCFLKVPCGNSSETAFCISPCGLWDRAQHLKEIGNARWPQGTTKRVLGAVKSGLIHLSWSEIRALHREAIAAIREILSQIQFWCQLLGEREHAC